MIIGRITWRFRPGNLRKAVEFAKEVAAMPEEPPGSRVYTPYAGPSGIVVEERPFESAAARDKWWAEWRSSPRAAAFMERWTALEPIGGGVELWNLEE